MEEKFFDTSFFERETLQEVANLYCRTFMGNEYSNLELAAAEENIQKHTKYEGFIGLTAKDLKGKLIGFSYGYKRSEEHTSELQSHS